jgi:hypothetical protein
MWAEKTAWGFIQEENTQFELMIICPPTIRPYLGFYNLIIQVFGQLAQYIESTNRLSTSSQALYAVLSGQQREITPQAVLLCGRRRNEACTRH